jgi:hypothetical protein
MRLVRIAGLAACALAMSGFASFAAHAQNDEGKKPRMYTYYSSWAIPRAKWADMEKASNAETKSMDKAVSSGSIVGYGDDETVVHQEDGITHDGWFSSMSMAGILNTLNDAMQSGSTVTSVYQSATKHADQVFVSRYYNWKPGSYKGAYTRTSLYKLKDSAPDDAVDVLAKNYVVPTMEKLLADGTIVEYEIDEQVVHTDSPALFFIDFITTSAEGQDKVAKALMEARRANPLAGPAFESWTDYSAHRDFLVRGNATYK